MTYETASKLAQQGGTIYFLVLFAAVIAYAMWPKNRKGFEDAANLPFDEDLD